jgi:hypothetical protein
MRVLRVCPKIALFLRAKRAVMGLCFTLVFALTSMLSCVDSRDLSLLEVHEIEIDEDAALLYVHGNGFVSEARCTILLEGVEYPHGQPSRALSLGAPCRVLSDARAVVDLAETALLTRARAWFEGKLTLRLSAADGGRTVSGTTEAVRLRLGAYGQRSGVDEALVQAQKAARFQRSVGIRSVEATGRGLVVTSVDPASGFVRAGGAEGDVIRRINGAPVEEASDLLAPSGAERARFDLVRRGQGSVTLSVSLDARPRLDPAIWLVCGLLALLAGALIPSVPHRFKASAQEVLPWYGAAGALVLLSYALFGAVDAGFVWLVAFAAHGAHLGLAYARGTKTPVAFAQEASDVAVATLSISALALSVGTLRTPLLASAVGEVGSSTVALFSPSGFLALLGLFCVLRPSTRAVHDGKSTLLLRATGAFLACALGLGAGTLLGAPESSGSCVASLTILLFALEGGLSLYALSQPSDMANATRRILGVALSLASVALTWLEPHLPGFPLPKELVLSVTLGLSLGHLGRSAFARATARRVPLRDPALSPFL